MPNKIKIAFILVAIVAVFSVYELAQYVHVIANKSSAIEEGTPLPSPEEDADHDGLSNQQEIIWGTDPFNPDTDGDGFKDGEEVKSGHNPLIPGPNDLISANNLTDQFSQLLVSGLYSGDLKPESKNYSQAVADITSSVTDSSKYVFNKSIDSSSFQTISGTMENRTAYLKQIAPLFQQFQNSLADGYQNALSSLDTIGAKGFGDDTIKKFFSDQTNTDQTLLDKGSALLVPKDFSNAHAKFLTLLQKTRDINSAIAAGESDPVKASVALKSFFDLYQDYVQVLKTYLDETKVQHLDPALLEQQ